ncbi:hypothetical protein HQ394_14215 [Defluviicoccus vanus]|uniref:Uncharacterized protein n=1 Tax=Defluviicoccus vanus TaxID=111831 RepID=A0A7H1N3I7_9PROT|nr:hypothetical protein HQ394_14215 [Defluviicoccus vanus]
MTACCAGSGLMQTPAPCGGAMPGSKPLVMQRGSAAGQSASARQVGVP